jgi:alpha,alpha-trehalase
MDSILRGLGSRLLPKLILLAAALCSPSVRADADAQSPQSPQSPQSSFQELFVAVQEAQIFPDQKSFADAVPKTAPRAILEAFRARHPVSRAALEQFVAEHFIMPLPAAAAPAPADQLPLSEHIDRLWDVLTRRSATVPMYSSLLPLPLPYVVPGGRFREIYYWDSYFTMLGLAASGRRDLIESMVGDFAYLIDTYGHVPNGTRTYYLSRSQPPFFYWMVGLSAPQDAPAAYAKYLAQLRREYAFWMDGERVVRPGAAHRRVVAMQDGTVLNRYWDDSDTPRDESYREDTKLARGSGRPAARLYRDIRAAAESGWDFGSRWFADGRSRATMDTTELVPIDLNSLLYGMEIAIRSGCERSGDAACAAEFKQRAARRRAAIDHYLWEPSGAYVDFSWTQQRPVPRLSAATLYPLFVGVASPQQAAAVARIARRRLLESGGIVTTPITTGQQWDSPNGWAPLQWIAISGLRDYGHSALARTIACRWLSNVTAVYRHTGKLLEKYDVVHLGRNGGGGEYPAQDGFGWTNGVTRRLLNLYPAAACGALNHSAP